MGGYEHLCEVLSRQQKRTEIGVPFDAKLLISVGELSNRKNHRVVVEALQKLPEDYWYVIVGKGDLKEKLEALDHTGRLKLLGFRTDIIELLHCADLFVFPSLHEGLPVALMEAIAAGLPCVASRIRGNTDLLDEGLVQVTGVYDWISNLHNIPNQANSLKIKSYDKSVVESSMIKIYAER